MHDSAWLSVMWADGSRVVVRTDSVTMASWADHAELLTDPTSGAKLAYPDPRVGRLAAITFVRLSPDANSAYRIVGDDGVSRGSVIRSPDTVRVLFGAMRGQPQTTMSATLPGLLLMTFQPQKPIRARYVPPARYPESLRSMNVEGVVILSFIVDSTGHLDKKSIQVIRGTDPAFTSAAEETLRRTEFDPAEQNGHPVTARTSQAYNFQLSHP